MGPRIGYAIDNWLPYLRVGGVFTGGSQQQYDDFHRRPGTASFCGGKNFKSNGFGASVGTDIKIDDAWFFRADYTYVNLGKGIQHRNAVHRHRGHLYRIRQFRSAQHP